MQEPTVPEHDKLHKAKEELGTEAIGAFLEWLQHDGIQLARFWDHETNCESSEDDQYPFRHEGENGRCYKHKKSSCGYEGDGTMTPVHEPINKLLARYAGIDLAKLEEEKRALLEYERSRQRAG